MIDFVSTRDGCDQESMACARLLTAVITTAIRDAVCVAPKRDCWEKTDVFDKAREAIVWLFDDASVFPLYASLVGSDAESIRRALLADREGEVEPIRPLFSDADRKILLRRLHLLRTGAPLV
jgi:hypothetical protein